jgi:hypothetical protein
MKHYWRNDRVRIISHANVIEHINFLNKYDGTDYTALANHANEFYKIKSSRSYFGAIVTHHNLLGLYELKDDNTIKLSDTAKLIVNNNELIEPFLEYFLLKFQFPRPHLVIKEEVTVPFLIILKILLKLYIHNSDDSYFTRREFYNLFNENANRIKLVDIDDHFINNLIDNNRIWGLSQPAITGTDDLTYDNNLLCNSQFIDNSSIVYNNPVDFYIGLSKDINKINFAQFVLNHYENRFFNYNQNTTIPQEKKDIKNQWSKYSNNKIEFFNYLNQKNMLQNSVSFRQYCNDKGFHFDETMIRRFLTSLSAKSFLLLTGISGTGKSKIAELFGQFMSETNQGDFLMKAVGSNWNDNKNLLGYFNPIIGGGTYIDTEFVRYIREANLNPQKTFIFLLDEMNLSYTERYFSDFLSALESLNKDIILPDGSVIYWTNNLKIIGTINEDETTHTLSPKVIDRANIIEMNGSIPSEYIAVLIARNDVKIQNLITKDWNQAFITHLDSIYEALDGKFGYRTIDEISNYVIINVEFTGKDYLEFLDEQIYQKLLPKLHGTRGEILEKLEKLQSILDTPAYEFISSNAKVIAMINQVRKTGFTSFVTA